MATVVKNNGSGQESKAVVDVNGNSTYKPNSKAATTTTAAMEFVLVPQSSMNAVIRVLKARLPKSANVYNCAVRLSRNPGDFEMFTLGGDLTQHAWILVKLTTQSVGAKQLFTASPPGLPSGDGGAASSPPPHVRQAFIDTPVIDWDDDFEFVGLDSALGALITEISTFVKGHVITSHVNFCYYMPTEEALKLEVPDIENEGENGQGRVRVERLDTERGTEFVARRWKYTGEGTRKYVRTMIEKHPSTGVYIDDQPVSGVISHAEMFVGMLATDPAYRNKGYALVVMNNHLRNLAREGYMPASCVENRNEASKRFHAKLGMRYSHGTVDINNIGF